MLSPAALTLVAIWGVILILGIIALLRVPPDRIPDVLERLFPWRRK
ncbi:MAG TPA: hypothetical protein VHJ18_16505 [Streptosporangiaceae bacterium]|jgi:hypothetical protein|nr:hypothetical protein [Streptosporangiaceae bacterium]